MCDVLEFNNMLIQSLQTIAPQSSETLCLRGLVSPYFQLTVTRKMGPRRDINFSLATMIKALLLGYSPSGSSANIDVLLRDTNNVYDVALSIPLTIADSDTDAIIRSAAPGAVTAYLSGLGVTVNSTEWMVHEAPPAALANAPQAAIADAPADATTNYNTITTLLGALTGAVNTANSKQNDIATKFNTLLGELRTLGLIAT